MNNLFKNKYRPETIRLENWDYSNDGFYFIAICVKNKINAFGVIKNNIIGLSTAGCLVHKFWRELPDHYPNCFLDEYIIMPDHMHGIIKIRNNYNCDNGLYRRQNETGICRDGAGICRDGAYPVSTNAVPTTPMPMKMQPKKNIHYQI